MQTIDGHRPTPLTSLLKNTNHLTAPLSDLLPEEIDHLTKALQSKGINPQAGLEIEIGFYPRLRIPLNQQAQQALDQYPGHRAIVEQCDLDARQWILYELSECHPETREWCEKIFNPEESEHGYGLIDGENVFELKLKKCSPVELVERRRRINGYIAKKAAEYNLGIGRVGHHISVSFDDRDGNIFAPSHPELGSLGGQLIAGITAATYDAFPALTSQRSLNEPCVQTPVVDTSLSRSSMNRFASERVEVRPDNALHVDPEFVLATALAGALEGIALNDPDRKNASTAPAEIVNTPKIKRPSSRYRVTAKILSSSHIKPDGKLALPERYIHDKQGILIHSLTGLEMPSASLLEEKTKRYGEPLVKFFSDVSITETAEGPVIQWPTDEDSPDTYTLIPGSAFDRPVTIDVAALRDEVKCKEITRQLVTPQGYDLNDTSLLQAAKISPDGFAQSRQLQDARILRLANSPILRNHFRPEFYGQMVGALADKFPQPFQDYPTLAPDCLKKRTTSRSIPRPPILPGQQSRPWVLGI